MSRGSIELLRDPSFGPYLCSRLLSSMGVWIFNVVGAILTYDLTRSTFLVGMFSVAQFLPQALLAPWAGARADRRDRRNQIVFGRSAVGASSAGLAILLYFSDNSQLPGVFPIFCAALIAGVGFAISVPAQQAAVPALVMPGELDRAIALDALPFTIARAVGPAIGASVYTLAGARTAFAITSAASFTFAATVSLVRMRPVPQDAGDPDRSVAAGLRYIRQDAAIIIPLLGIAAVGFGVDPIVTLTPLIAEELGGDSTLVGWLASAFGAGAALSIFVLGTSRRRAGLARVSSAGLMVFAAGIFGLVPSTVVPVAMGSLALAGSGMMHAVTALTSLLQSRTPEHMRGRIMSLWAVGFVGSRPVAALANGSLADFYSLDAALLTTVAVLVSASVLTHRKA